MIPGTNLNLLKIFFFFCHKSGCLDCHLCPVIPFPSQSTRTVPNGIDYFLSVQFNHSVTSNSLQPHEPQHARPPCPSPTPGAHPNSCSLSQWCNPTISSSVTPFSCPQSFPASGSFQMSQLFASGGQRHVLISLSLEMFKERPKTSCLEHNIGEWTHLI